MLVYVIIRRSFFNLSSDLGVTFTRFIGAKLTQTLSGDEEPTGVSCSAAGIRLA
jgi:hypothetical protein